MLPRMPHLTRLELVGAFVDDSLLCVIGNSLPQLQRLVFDTEFWASSSSQEGADAIAHVGHIELVNFKGFRCYQNLQLLQLPGMKRVVCEYVGMSLSAADTQVGSVWSPEKCRCGCRGRNVH